MPLAPQSQEEVVNEEQQVQNSGSTPPIEPNNEGMSPEDRAAYINLLTETVTSFTDLVALMEAKSLILRANRCIDASFMLFFATAVFEWIAYTTEFDKEHESLHKSLLGASGAIFVGLIGYAAYLNRKVHLIREAIRERA